MTSGGEVGRQLACGSGPARWIVSLSQQRDIAQGQIVRQLVVRNASNDVDAISDAVFIGEKPKFADSWTVTDEHCVHTKFGTSADGFDEVPPDAATKLGVPSEVALDASGEHTVEAKLCTKLDGVPWLEEVEINTVGDNRHVMVSLGVELFGVVPTPNDDSVRSAVADAFEQLCSLASWPRCTDQFQKEQGGVASVDDEWTCPCDQPRQRRG